MSAVIEILYEILEKSIHILPYFIMSIGLSILIRFLKLDGLIKQAFSKKIGLAIIMATFVGAFSPLCSCTVIPVVAGLLSSGVPLAPIMSFWIASPTMDPEIFALSTGILGLPISVARLLSTLLLSLMAGYITWALGKTKFMKNFINDPIKNKSNSKKTCCSSIKEEISCCSKDVTKTTSSQKDPSWKIQITNNFQLINWKDYLKEVAKEGWRWGRWLLLAFVMEVLIVKYIPQESVAQFLGNGNWFAIPLAALIGIPLYLTEISSLPIVSGLLSQGMVPGAAISFLIAGPVTTLPAMSAVFGIVKRRLFILYMALGLGGAILFGVISNLILSFY